jgi:hypothetical protein
MSTNTCDASENIISNVRQTMHQTVPVLGVLGYLPMDLQCRLCNLFVRYQARQLRDHWSAHECHKADNVHLTHNPGVMAIASAVLSCGCSYHPLPCRKCNSTAFHHHPLAFPAVILATSVVIWVLLMLLVSTRQLRLPESQYCDP